MKQCSICGETKSLDSFYTKTNGKLKANCRGCTRKRNQAYHTKNREKLNANSVAYRKEHPDRIKKHNDLPEVRERRLKHKRESHAAIKLDVLKHYSNFLECACCGETMYAALTIDHPNNDGAEHCRQIGLKHTGGTPMYEWIKRNNYPDGFQVLCWNCNSGKGANGGICPHERQAEPTSTDALYSLKIRKECISHYSNGTNACQTCGESVFGLLIISGPRIMADGKSVKSKLAQYLHTRNYPEGYTIKCWNCMHAGSQETLT